MSKSLWWVLGIAAAGIAVLFLMYKRSTDLSATQALSLNTPTAAQLAQQQAVQAAGGSSTGSTLAGIGVALGGLGQLGKDLGINLGN